MGHFVFPHSHTEGLSGDQARFSNGDVFAVSSAAEAVRLAKPVLVQIRRWMAQREYGFLQIGSDWSTSSSSCVRCLPMA